MAETGRGGIFDECEMAEPCTLEAPYDYAPAPHVYPVTPIPLGPTPELSLEFYALGRMPKPEPEFLGFVFC